MLKGNNGGRSIINAMYHWWRSTWDWRRMIRILMHDWDDLRHLWHITVVSFYYWWWCQFRLYPCKCYFWRSMNLLNRLSCLLASWGRFIPSGFWFFPSGATWWWDGQYNWWCTGWTTEWRCSYLTTRRASFRCRSWWCRCSRWGGINQIYW